MSPALYLLGRNIFFSTLLRVLRLSLWWCFMSRSSALWHV